MSMNLLYSLREGVLSMQRSRMSSIWTVSTIAIALTLFGIFLTVTYNVQYMVKKIQQNIVLEAFIDGSIEKENLKALQHKLQAMPDIETVKFISKKAALARFQKEWGDDPMTILDENPLPMSFEVKVGKKISSSSQVQKLASEIETLAGIDEVAYKGAMIEMINKWSRYVYLVDAVLFVLVLASTLFLVSNTLRLTIIARKKTIGIMQLVGATRGFIRRPYLVQGVLQGAIGGGIASLITWIIFSLLAVRFQNLFELPALLMSTPLLLGIVLSFWGSEISVRRFLSDI